MAVLRRIAPTVAILTAIALLAGGTKAMYDSLSAGGVAAVRAAAVAYMICDVVLVSAVIILLIVRDRRAPDALERRLPYRGRWLWYFLLGVSILCYLGLAPTFLYLYLQMRKS